MTPAPSRTLVVGSRGLVGSAVVREVTRRERERPRTALVPWHDEPLAARALIEVAASLPAGGDQRVLWCAGAGVTGMSEADGARELRLLTSFLEALPGAGTVFLASSAGGVYGGSLGPPFDEHTVAAPISAYGAAKRALEDAVHAWADAHDDRTAVLGRLSNVYGPGQDLRKAQGLISHLCSGAARRRAVSIYVPLDTRRDYVFVDDAARRIVDTVELAPRGQVTTKNICSQESVTVATVVATVRAVAKRPVPILLGDSPLRRAQTLDLRLRSVVLPEVDAGPVVPLGVGVAATMRAISRQFHDAGVATPR